MREDRAFEYEVTSREGVIEIAVSGYMDVKAAEHYLDEFERTVRASAACDDDSVRLVFVDRLSDFDAGSVGRIHGSHFARLGSRLKRVAVVSPRASVTMGIAIAKLVTDVPVRQFAEVSDAYAWLSAD